MHGPSSSLIAHVSQDTSNAVPSEHVPLPLVMSQGHNEHNLDL
jgi:hypothetical protein